MLSESCVLVCLSPFVGMRRQPEGEADAWLGWLDSKKNSKIYIFLQAVPIKFIQLIAGVFEQAVDRIVEYRIL